MIDDPTTPEQGTLIVSMADEPSVATTRYLPFEARNVRSAKVTRGILGKPVSLGPGSYWVTAKLPDGAVLESAPVEVAAASTATAVLQPPAPLSAGGLILADAAGSADAAAQPLPSSVSKLTTGILEKVEELDDPPLWQKVLLRPLLIAVFEKTLGYFGVPVPTALRSQGSGEIAWLQRILGAQLRRLSRFDTLADAVNSLATPSGPEARFVAASWDIRSSTTPPKPTAAPRQSKLVIGPMTVLFANVEGQFIEVQGESGTRLVVAVPSDGGCRTVVTCSMESEAFPDDQAESMLKIDFSFSDSDANALFQYMAQVEFLEARAMAAGIVESAAEPTGATSPTKLAMLFAAYVQLRENRLDTLDNVLERLGKEWPRSPDVAAVRMEAYARRGNHAEASALCASLPALGIPFISSGIAYLQQRTRQFLDSLETSDSPIAKRGFSLTPQLASELEQTWRMVTPLGSGLDSRTIITAIRLPRS
jgi:hypothetical protein